MYYPVNTPSIFKKIFPNLVWGLPASIPTLYLSFDDGPEIENTEWILKALETYHAKATFFCLGRQIEKNPELYQKIISEGHLCGNHGYSHLNGWNNNTKKYLEDVLRAEEFIDSKLFRPPYGKLTFGQYQALKKLNFKIVPWDIMPGDFDNKINEEKCLSNILRFSKNGSIIVLHENAKSQKKLRYVLPRLLEYFTEKGFTFSTIQTS
jgi:peptidoglycan/xylan/chitin deacetylase (PgdA/CDA1 family)